MICGMHIGGLGSVGMLMGKSTIRLLKITNIDPAPLKGFKTAAVQGIVQASCIPSGSSLSSISPIAIAENLKFLAGGLYLTGVGMAVLGSHIRVGDLS